MAYHHANGVYIIKGATRLCISSRASVHFTCGLMICNSDELMICNSNELMICTILINRDDTQRLRVDSLVESELNCFAKKSVLCEITVFTNRLESVII